MKKKTVHPQQELSFFNDFFSYVCHIFSIYPTNIDHHFDMDSTLEFPKQQVWRKKDLWSSVFDGD